MVNTTNVKNSLYTDGENPLTEKDLIERRAVVERSMLLTKPAELAVMSVFIAIMMVGFGYYMVEQLVRGLTVTNLSQKVFWGAYITSFVFWIGVSHVGMLISAVLRMFGLKYRTPITRVAEEVTLVSLVMGAASVLIDMGRFDRAHHILLYANFTSPLVWDVISITFYLTGSTIFFMTPLIPDMAYYRDKLDPSKHFIRQKIYSFMSFGFKGSPKQYEIINKEIMDKLKYVILPVALSVHTVVSWIFAMAWRPGWNSTIFGPYFISGAIFSGTAALVTALVVFTSYYKLGDLIRIKHIQGITTILIVTNFAYMYFTLNEYLPGAYKSADHEVEILTQIFYGDQARIFWFVIVGTMVIPMVMSFMVMFTPYKYTGDEDYNRRLRKVYWLSFVSSVLVNIGAWFKRWVILIPSLRIPVISHGEDYKTQVLIDHTWYPYTPSTAEVWISFAQVAFFIFFYWALNKLLPLIPMWEVEHEWEVDEIIVDGVKTPQRKFEESYGFTDREFLYHH